MCKISELFALKNASINLRIIAGLLNLKKIRTIYLGVVYVFVYWLNYGEDPFKEVAPSNSKLGRFAHGAVVADSVPCAKIAKYAFKQNSEIK